MRTIRLLPNGPATSCLGYGTASLMGRIGTRASLRLLERAYDEGIRYFDTAPSYGLGEAEAVVGRFASGRRDSIVLATKFGLKPILANKWTNVAKRMARPLLTLTPALRRRARSTLSAGLNPVAHFNVEDARRSLENSLHLLKTDYIDILLMHECRIVDLRNESLLNMLHEAQAAGKIRAFGIGTDIATVQAAVRDAPEFTRVLQFASNAASPNLNCFDTTDGRAYITHSPFGGVGRTLFGKLSGTAVSDRSRIAKALLRSAVRNNPGGVVLFSAQSPEHIASNVGAIAASDEEDEALLTPLREHL